MKFKYFLRGLGIGLIFASVIFLTAYQSNIPSITDEEIVRRAKELGMEEKEDSVAGLISDKTENDKRNTGKSKKEEGSTSAAENPDSTGENTAVEQSTEEQTDNADTTEQKETAEDERKPDDTVSLTIDGGSSSYPVCQKLKELGMIENADEFDAYLIENGYAARIRVGTHTLKKGMSFREIAEAISDPL
ncbi:MAG: hypothetical protein NC300_01275 [Bacteroidales bacterium]|nr:hypothetical protein [Clostridium sp.]MCM1202756.1 hypothetical protein [Bacteroidales bacterium]